MLNARQTLTASDSLANLRVESLEPIALFVGSVGGIWFWMVLWPGMLPLMPIQAWIGSLLLVCSAALGWVLRRHYVQTASCVLIGGLLLGIYYAISAFRTPSLAYLLAVAIIFASVLLSRGGMIFTAVLAGLLTLSTNLMPGGVYIAPGDIALILGELSVVALASWLSSHNLYTALVWFEQSYRLAREHEAAARNRRAELRKALDDLESALSRLHRSNQELSVARQQAEQERALKEQFVANISHELRTPLNLIMGFAEMMFLSPESYDGVTWSHDLVSDVGEMYRAARHLQSLVSDVLDLSRIDARRLPMLREWVEIPEVISEVVETVKPLFRQRGLYFRAELADGLPRLLIDRLRLRQVLINLLNNAARFTDNGGVTIRTEVAKDSLLVSVQDTGVGVPEEQIESIFETFTQASGQVRRGGAGLGLAISRQLIELHGGRMWATSKVGVGSTFFFSLPLPGAAPQTASLQRLPSRSPHNLTGSPIVVVDPDPEVGAWLRRYLEGYPILAVQTPLEAGKLVESEHPVAIIVNQPPDAPPDSWVEALGAQCDRFNVPVLRCSIPSSSWVVRATGIDDFLMKPVSRFSLATVVEKHCAEGSSVLVADDNPGFVELISRMLGTMPQVARVLRAHSGAEALRLAHEFKPDLVLVDLLMPDMDGFEVLRALRREPIFECTCMVVITATSYAEELLQRHRGCFTLIQPRSLVTRSLVELITAALALFRPDYFAASTASSA